MTEECKVREEREEGEGGSECGLSLRSKKKKVLWTVNNEATVGLSTGSHLSDPALAPSTVRGNRRRSLSARQHSRQGGDIQKEVGRRIIFGTMQHTRSLVGSCSRSSRAAALGVSRPTTVFATASLHTARAAAEEKRGFLSRLNPFAKPTTPAEPAATPAAEETDATKVAKDLSVEIEEEKEEKEPIPR